MPQHLPAPDASHTPAPHAPAARRRRSRTAVATAVLTTVVAGAAVLAALVGAARSVQAGDPVPAPSARARSVVGLGDSVTAGSNCTCAPFVERFGRLLAARDGRPVTATNLGVPGLTTGSLGQQLDDPEVSASVASADTLLVTIGANDLAALEERWARTGCDVTCRAPSVAAMARGLASDLARIRALGHEGQRVEVTTYWNVFEDGDVADRERGAGFADWSDAVTVAADAAICRTARSFGDTCVDLYAPFLSTDGHRDPTALLSSDGDHPNSAGHDVIARALLAASPP